MRTLTTDPFSLVVRMVSQFVVSRRSAVPLVLSGSPQKKRGPLVREGLSFGWARLFSGRATPLCPARRRGLATADWNDVQFRCPLDFSRRGWSLMRLFVDVPLALVIAEYDFVFRDRFDVFG